MFPQHNRTKPVLHRPPYGDIQLYLPYSRDNRRQLKAVIGPRSDLKFLKTDQTWIFKRTHFTRVAIWLEQRYPEATIFYENDASKRCDTRCQNARGQECVCSCAGKYHGGLRGLLDRWIEVGETTLIRPGTLQSVYSVGTRVS